MPPTGRRRPRLRFCLAVATALVATRLAIVDHQFLTPTTLPPHDMYQGAAYFATNLHALRLEGDLAWWNPISNFGYAQYYQSFLSPLAPTCGHVVFILWALVVRGLAALGVSLPEYLQYVAVTYLVMPWLAYAAFLAFCSLVFTSRAAVALAGVVYAFSGIGLWLSAWFYFQEPFTLYLLLATVVAALRRPVPSRLLLMLVAALVQIASFNYWTVHDSWFLVLVLGAYAGLHTNQVRRLGRRLRTLGREHGVATGTALAATALMAALWVGLLATIVQDQAPNYARTERAAGAYGPEEASARIHELRSFTTDFFHAGFSDAMVRYARDNPMHNARYLGAELVPLLAAFAVLPWRRRERWLIACAAALFCICLGPPLLLRAWAAAPGFSNIVHFFYFYSHHLQVLVALMAAAALDTVLVADLGAASRRVLRLGVGAAVALSVLLLVELGVFSSLFPNEDAGLQAGLVFAVASLVVGVPLLRLVGTPSAVHRHLLVGVLLALTFADLTRYYWLVERADIAFTAQHRFLKDVQYPFSPELRATLRRPWADPDPAQGFAGGVAGNMPIVSSVWPVNHYIISRYALELSLAAGGKGPSTGADLGFFPDELVRQARGDASEVAAPHAGLLVAAAADGLPPAASRGVPAGSGPFQYRFRAWRYNGFGIDLSVPSNGWVVVGQLFDPAWRVSVDGRPVVPRRAEHMLMAVPVDAGARTLEMDYRPRARRLYWPASALLLATCAGLLAGARRAATARYEARNRQRSSGRATAVTTVS